MIMTVWIYGEVVLYCFVQGEIMSADTCADEWYLGSDRVANVMQRMLYIKNNLYR